MTTDAQRGDFERPVTAPVPAAARDTWRDQLAAALHADGHSLRFGSNGYELDATLRVLVAAQREAAAEALDDAASAYESDDEQPHINHLADTVYRPGDCLSSIWLRVRAEELRAEVTR